MIELCNVTKVYETGGRPYTALSVNTHIEKGEFVVITGRSGSGKSTLLNLLSGIDRPTTGEVKVMGTAITDYSESQMAEWRGGTMGIVFQFFQLIPNLTVLENILLPMDLVQKKRTGNSTGEALSLLDRVGMRDHADKMPSELSGGEQQRVAIARSLANHVPILIADEPTGNLDSKNTCVILDLFRELAEDGMTIIMVTHETEHIKGSTREIVLKDGRIVKDSKIKKGGDTIGIA